MIISSTNLSNPLNYRSRKIKVIRSPSSTNAKDMSLSSSAIKLKSVEAYAAMLTEPKLAHFFKCMGHNCSYTTDSTTQYSQHYTHHEEASKQNNTMSFNYDKCAYCYISLSDWNSMKIHLWEKHSHCRYQCGYCFYRAIVPSYVQQHQVIIFTYYVIRTILLKEKEYLINQFNFSDGFSSRHCVLLSIRLEAKTSSKTRRY